MDKNSLVKYVKYGTILFSLVAIALILHFTIKTANDETCYRQTYTDYEGAEKYNGTILKSDGYLLQQFSTTGTKIKEYKFCYHIISNDGATHKVSVINQLETVLGKDVVDDGETCTKIIVYDNQPHQYIGVRCDDCTDSSYLIVKQEISGVDVKQITHNNTFNDKTADYTLYGYESCGRAIKDVFHWYLWFMGGLWLVLAILYFLNKTEDTLYKGW